MKYKNQFADAVVCIELLAYCAKLNRLTITEAGIVYSFARGDSVQKIATRKNVSVKTTSAQKRSAYKKMNISNDVEFIHYLYYLKNSDDYILRRTPR